MQLSVAHHHGFKCAGSSVVHVLNRNWPRRVLHVEHRRPDHRIRCGDVRHLTTTGEHVALTSHLLTMPAPGQALAHVHFALLRDPLARLVSAYKFAPEQRRFGGFREFVRATAHYASDYQVRQLAVPGLDGDGWEARPEAVPLGAPGVLLGLVERFADSMFLLEQRLAKVGIAFDGSVGAAHNAGGTREPELELDDAVVAEVRRLSAGDCALRERVAASMDAELAAVDADGKGRAEHRLRCAARAEGREAYLGLGPDAWIYVEP